MDLISWSGSTFWYEQVVAGRHLCSDYLLVIRIIFHLQRPFRSVRRSGLCIVRPKGTRDSAIILPRYFWCEFTVVRTSRSNICSGSADIFSASKTLRVKLRVSQILWFYGQIRIFGKIKILSRSGLIALYSLQPLETLYGLVIYWPKRLVLQITVSTSFGNARSRRLWYG